MQDMHSTLKKKNHKLQFKWVSRLLHNDLMEACMQPFLQLSSAKLHATENVKHGQSYCDKDEQIKPFSNLSNWFFTAKHRSKQFSHWCNHINEVEIGDLIQ